MAIDTKELKAEIKEHVKTALQATGEVQYPDLLMYVSQQIIHPLLQQVVEGLEKKELVKCADSTLGTIITKTKKKKKGKK